MENNEKQQNQLSSPIWKSIWSEFLWGLTQYSCSCSILILPSDTKYLKVLSDQITSPKWYKFNLLFFSYSLFSAGWNKFIARRKWERFSSGSDENKWKILRKAYKIGFCVIIFVIILTLIAWLYSTMWIIFASNTAIPKKKLSSWHKNKWWKIISSFLTMRVWH